MLGLATERGVQQEAQKMRAAEHDLWDPLSDKLWDRDTDWDRESVVELRRIAYILDSILKLFTWLPAFCLLLSSFATFIVICFGDFDDSTPIHDTCEPTNGVPITDDGTCESYNTITCNTDSDCPLISEGSTGEGSYQLACLWGWLTFSLLYGLYFLRQGAVPGSRAVIAQATAWHQPKARGVHLGCTPLTREAYTLNPDGNMVSDCPTSTSVFAIRCFRNESK